MAADPDTIRRALRQAAAHRAQAEEMRAKASVHLRDWCVRARDAGLPVTAIARETGLSRQAIYDMLGRNGRKAA